MINTDLQNALDDCLACLERGEGLDACLERYPQQRAGLEPLLRAANTLRARRDAWLADAVRESSSLSLARARGRVMAEASRRQIAEHAPLRAPRPRLALPWAHNQSPARAFVTLASIIVLMVGILGGGSIVSANSLPGDPLYGIKRVAEKVRLALALSQEQRAQLAQQFEVLRLREVLKVVEQRREVEVEFAGPIESVEGDTITVQGIPVRLAPAAQTGTQPAVGTKVNVLANTQEDGSLEASLIAVAPDGPTNGEALDQLPVATVTLPPEQRPSPTPARPTATPTEVEKPTEATPTTEEPTPLPPTAPPEEHTPLPTTAVATVTSTPFRTATRPNVTATDRPTLTARPTATRTSTPSPTPAPPPREVKVLIEGTISEIASQYWVVDGQRIVIRTTTQVNEAAAQAQVGGWAIAHAIIEPDGQVIAQEIAVVRGPQRAPEQQEFSGVIEALGETQWTIAGQLVIVTPQTVITGVPKIGAIAHVKADKYADGRVVAQSIRAETLEIVQFAGIIEQLLPDRWVVSGQEVLIVQETQIEGTPVVGAIAEIEAVAAPDGTLTARQVRIDASTVQAGGT